MHHLLLSLSLAAITLTWLDSFQGRASAADAPTYQNVQCEGFYPGHLQGICIDSEGAIYWSFTTELVKTDTQGKITGKVNVANHHGDLTWADGRVYVAVNLGEFNEPAGKADSWVYVYRDDDLSLLSKHEVQDVVHGAGGIAHHDGRFIVVGGLPGGIEVNYLYEYDRQMRLVETHEIASGQTLLGIQTAAFADGQWWLGCYGKELLRVSESFELVGKYDFDCGLGVVGLPAGFLIGRGGRTEEGNRGSVVRAAADDRAGLIVE